MYLCIKHEVAMYAVWQNTHFFSSDLFLLG